MLTIITGFIAFTGYSIKQSLNKHDKVIEENVARKTYTTEKMPDEEYTNPEMLHTMFEKKSGLKLDDEIQDKKLTIYNYKFTLEDDNQEGDIFSEFGKELEKNGYEHIAESADGDGYKNQYELYYKEIHYMIYTESSPDIVKLSILNYNDRT